MDKKLTGVLTGIFISSSSSSLVTKRKEIVRVLDNGLEGDKHAGWFRGADARVKHYTKGTKIWNSRQISIVSEEELKEVAEAMKIPQVKPEWLGVNICLKGIPRLSLLPPRTKIFIPDYYGGEDVGLFVTALNKPCTHPGAVIQDNYPDVNGLECRFPKAAHNKRGVVAVVERGGRIKEGSTVSIWIPDQSVYE